MKQLKSWIFSLLLISILLPVLYCSVSTMESGTGTGSETTNGMTATVHYQDGSPAAFATVKIRPADFLRDTAKIVEKKNEMVDTVTDPEGKISLGSLDSGEYVLEIKDSRRSEGALIHCKIRKDSLVNCGIVFLDQLNSITGSVDYSELPESTDVYVQIYGLDLIKKVDSSGIFDIDSLAPGNYSIRVITSQPTYIQKIITDVKVSPVEKAVVDKISLPLKSSWNYSKQIILNTSATGADVSENVYKFPVLIRLTKNNFDFKKAEANGKDLRFIKKDNTPLSFEIECWDHEKERADIWVKVDTILGHNDSQYIFMLWGNPNATSTENSENVFDTATGFQGVWHMDSSDDMGLMDATNNHYNAKCYSMNTRISTVEGIVGDAQKFDGKTNYAIVTNSSNSKLNFSQYEYYTISAWVYSDSMNYTYQTIISKGNQQYGLQLSFENKYQFFEYAHNRGWKCTEAPAISKKWKFVVAVQNRTEQLLYVDGTLVNNTYFVVPGSEIRNFSENVCIGKGTADLKRWFTGMIDEIRIHNLAKNSNWIKLSYMNQRPDDRLVIMQVEHNEPKVLEENEQTQ